MVNHWHILLAEDDPLNQKIMLRLLTSRGHSVKVAHNGIDVLELLVAERFDMILMDLSMPVMDGLEATLAIRGDRSGRFDPMIPIIALSAHEQRDNSHRPGMSALNAYIVKPVNIERLFSSMDAILSGDRRRANNT
jgi:CheY-like chemotaxis protein